MTTSETAGLVVIGGSHAGHQVAIAARAAGFEGPVTVLSDERELPYQRPPLSKAYLMGKQPREALLFRPAAFYEEQGIDLRLGVGATAIDRAAHTVACDNGTILSYKKLVIATGTRVRPLNVPGSDLGGVHYIRTLADIDAIMAELDRVKSVVVIGGGFIGLEGAAALKTMGRDVAVVELADRLMARGVGATVSEYYATHHRAQGVDVRLSTGVESLAGEDGHVTGVVLSGGETLPADLVIVGIGVLPNQEIAAEAGIDCANGIIVDELTQTSDPDVLAVGDCAQFEGRFFDGPLRLESVQNATDQARTAGAAVAGEKKPYDSAPWFWSDQFDLKLQMTGITAGYDTEVIRGDVAAGEFSVFYFKGDKWLGTDTVNQPANHIASRRLLDAGYALSKAEAGDEGLALKELVKAARKGG